MTVKVNVCLEKGDMLLTFYMFNCEKSENRDVLPRKQINKDTDALPPGDMDSVH